MLPPLIAVGTFVGGMKGEITGTFVGDLNGESVGVIGAPSYSTSIPLICGFCMFRTKSIVMAVSVTNVDTVTM